MRLKILLKIRDGTLAEFLQADLQLRLLKLGSAQSCSVKYCNASSFKLPCIVTLTTRNTTNCQRGANLKLSLIRYVAARLVLPVAG